ncbi:AI-2E family transporter [Pseudonocardia abyssalis]|uniref:AI-2E family transporter n=1 Tax=Pseudonocardia abyssalis TaxID=2792008 RepID=A0ABS6UXF7_9PSEU|nr:AI-2E family transporter [Pseudonocardia abyssalis]MBW0118117.1 AI-2E family transporter [Pseudonocardia abyssalis]MBW0136958.1 AI-2E family transporter [Pseudonocardia abyssalis]
MTDAAPATRSGWTNPLFGFAAAVVTIAGLQAFGGLLGPLFLALVLMVTVSPIAGALRRRGVPRWLATLVTLGSVYAILVALVGSLVYAVAQLAAVLPTYSGRLNDLLNDASDLLATIGVGPAQIQTALDQFDIGSLVGVLQGFLAQFAGLLSNLLLILSVLLFMAFDSATFPERMKALARSRPHVVDALTSFAHGTRRFLAVATVFGLIIATLDVAVLLVLDVPLALLFGLLAFVANFVPNIGFLIALAPPALFALLEGGPGLMLAVVASFMVINVVLQTIIQPRFVGDAVGLSVTLTFLALVFWGFVVGPLGALLAIPLTLLAKALLVDMHPHTRWIDVLIRDDVPGADEPDEYDSESAGGTGTP